VPIVAAVHDRVDVDRIAFALDRRYGIATRGGLHCAPWAHGALGTLESGALRFGIGYGNTEEHIEMALGAVAEIVQGL
jgi:selenocysteine lyase/cysteine desulfurase